MKLNVISDLHINWDYFDESDWNIFEPEKLEPADYLIIAGDLGICDNCEEVADEIKDRTKGKFKDVLWIKGNHDYYYWGHGGNRPEKPSDNVRFDKLDGDVAIFGTTLWTPVAGYVNQHCVERDMNDYRCIPHWSTDIARKRYAEDLSWIKERLEYYRWLGKKVVIVTHHNPCLFMMDNGAKKHSITDNIYTDAAYYVNDGSCDDIKPDLWICGHVHRRFDKVVDGVRYIRNPIGYHGSWYGPCPQIKEDHWYDTIVEV